VNLLQEEIHELLLSFAEAGATVVRLKGGDPLVSYHIRFFLVSVLLVKKCNALDGYGLYDQTCLNVNVLLFGICRCLGGVVRKWTFYNSKVSMSKLFQVCC
jgi:hypothetical protein